MSKFRHFRSIKKIPMFVLFIRLILLDLNKGNFIMFFVFMLILFSSNLASSLTIQIDDDNLFATLRSPDFPKIYPKNANVEYKVTTKLRSSLESETSKLIARFQMFALESSSSCINDYLEVQDGKDSVSRFCGASHSGKVLKFDTLEPTFRFVSNNQTQSVGFAIELELVKSTCVFDLKDITNSTLDWSATISGPSESCIWSLETTPDKRIKLDFNELNLPSDDLCSINSIAISTDGDFSSELERYCGKKTPVDTIESKSNKVLIKLTKKDCHGRESRFSLNVTTTNELLLPVTQVVRRSCPCGHENGAGESRVNTRIVGGVEVQPPHRYPWLAALSMAWDEVFCGAALINDRYLLTAAHCLLGLAPGEVRVVLGAHDLRLRVGTLKLEVQALIPHEQYDRVRQFNDIALVKLKTPIAATDRMSCICLPFGQQDGFEDLRIAGWGRTEEGGASSEVPLEVKLPQVSQGRCARVYGSLMTPKKLCAGGLDSKDSCQGDSGGPLISQISGRTYLAGVTSFSIGCGRAGVPAVYTRTTEYVDWIGQRTTDAKWCIKPKPNVPATPVDKPLGGNLDHCGLPNDGGRRKRVVGGSNMTPLEYPWVVAIGHRGALIGAGVLISDRFVLTSAKNLQSRANGGTDIASMVVLVGVNDLTRPESNKQAISVVKVTMHPNLGQTHAFNYDFALIELKQSVNFRPVCLPWTSMPLYVGQGMYIAGWGRTSTYSSGSPVLQKATLNLLSKNQCNPAYLGVVTPQMMCAAGPGKDACFGDEGAPLAIPKQGRLYLAGIKSWGSSEGCAIDGKPSVFSDVRWALQWISKVTGLNVQ